MAILSVDEILQAKLGLPYELVNIRGTHFCCTIENASTSCSDFLITRTFKPKVEFFLARSSINQMGM